MRVTPNHVMFGLPRRDAPLEEWHRVGVDWEVCRSDEEWEPLEASVTLEMYWQENTYSSPGSGGQVTKMPDETVFLVTAPDGGIYNGTNSYEDAVAHAKKAQVYIGCPMLMAYSLGKVSMLALPSEQISQWFRVPIVATEAPPAPNSGGAGVPIPADKSWPPFPRREGTGPERM